MTIRRATVAFVGGGAVKSRANLLCKFYADQGQLVDIHDLLEYDLIC